MRCHLSIKKTGLRSLLSPNCFSGPSCKLNNSVRSRVDKRSYLLGRNSWHRILQILTTSEFNPRNWWNFYLPLTEAGDEIGGTLKAVKVRLQKVRIPLQAEVCAGFELGESRLDEDVRHPEGGLEVRKLGKACVMEIANGQLAADWTGSVVFGQTPILDQDPIEGDHRWVVLEILGSKP